MEHIDEVDFVGDVVAVRSKDSWRKEFFNHKASLIIPRTFDDKFLIAMRSATKHPFPGVWVCGVGGTCASGETFLDAAKREMQEEIGVVAALEVVNTFSYDDGNMRATFRVFTTKKPLDVADLTLDETEIQYMQAFTLSEIKELITEKPESCAPTAVAAFTHFLLGLKD